MKGWGVSAILAQREVGVERQVTLTIEACAGRWIAIWTDGDEGISGTMMRGAADCERLFAEEIGVKQTSDGNSRVHIWLA